MALGVQVCGSRLCCMLTQECYLVRLLRASDSISAHTGDSMLMKRTSLTTETLFDLR
jgi:hypothetical protein